MAQLVPVQHNKQNQFDKRKRPSSKDNIDIFGEETRISLMNEIYNKGSKNFQKSIVDCKTFEENDNIHCSI